jgi:hypothetical protein
MNPSKLIHDIVVNGVEDFGDEKMNILTRLNILTNLNSLLRYSKGYLDYFTDIADDYIISLLIELSESKENINLQEEYLRHFYQSHLIYVSKIDDTNYFVINDLTKKEICYCDCDTDEAYNIIRRFSKKRYFDVSRYNVKINKYQIFTQNQNDRLWNSIETNHRSR